MKLSTPKEMGGSGAEGATNPEQVRSSSSSHSPCLFLSSHRPHLPCVSPSRPWSELFACGYSACFLGAMGVAAKTLKKPLPKDTAIDAQVALNKGADGKLGLAVTFDIRGSGDKADLKAIAEEAHKHVCPYSHATRGNIDVQLRVV